MTIDRTQIGPMHKRYCELTGHNLPNTLGMIFRWECWLLAGFTMPDLVLVIDYLKRRIKEGKRSLECLRFRTLIQDTDLFAEHLSMARALSRRPPIDAGRREALRSSGRDYTPEQGKAKPVGDVIAGNKALKELLRLRDSL